ncbi:MAG: peptidoglycan DD-metalloendopeptidase family protein [Bdellovibrionales bacterium]
MCVFFLVRILNPAPDTKNASQEFIKKTEPSPAYTAVQKTLSFEEAFPHVIKKNTPLFPHLQKLEVPPIDIIEMVKAAKPLKNLSRLSSGTRFQIEQDAENKLLKAQFRLSAIETLEVKKAEGKWLPQMLTEEISIEHVSFLGEVHTSLWESAIEAKMDPYLITAMAEIFGWEVDFNREVRTKDKWRITAEKKLVKGEHVGWGSVLAAEYINSGKSYKAVLFRHEGKDVGYYSLEGENLRKMFLKSPLRFGRVTSRFNRRRFHPKLKKIRPHNGVDYGASIGTPVRSVANGTVTFAGRRGGGGKVLKIRHNSTYKTAYKHLSRYAKGIRKGRQVKQGQIVAYTGNTGLSTGPHLHYEFFVNGRFVDPLRQKFPSADPVPKKHKASFLEQSQTMVTTLPKWFPKNLVLAPEKGSTPPLSKPTEKEYCCLLNSPKAQAVDQI